MCSRPGSPALQRPQNAPSAHPAPGRSPAPTLSAPQVIYTGVGSYGAVSSPAAGRRVTPTHLFDYTGLGLKWGISESVSSCKNILMINEPAGYFLYWSITRLLSWSDISTQLISVEMKSPGDGFNSCLSHQSTCWLFSVNHYVSKCPVISDVVSKTHEMEKQQIFSLVAERENVSALCFKMILRTLRIHCVVE